MSDLASARSYRPVEDRLAEWRRTALLRQGRLDELEQIDDPDYHGRNLAARPGALVRVDSFLGTINSADIAAAYAPPGELLAAGYAFRREDPAHPTLVELRRRFSLDDVAGTGDTVERAVRLRTWLNTRWRHEVPLVYPPWDGLTILERAEQGEGFLCMHYAVALVHCCLALGIDGRVVNLHRGVADRYPFGDEALVEPPVDEHVVAEVHAPEQGGWVAIDPDFDCHFTQEGQPLSAWEIHCAHRDGRAPTAVKGPGAASYDELVRGDRAGPLLGAEAGDPLARAQWYESTLASYYAHVSILFRNDFLSDPDGPVPALHLVDTATPPILWYGGEAMRGRRDLLGPLAVARPFTERTSVLTDGNLETAWASDDRAVPHRLEVTLAEPAVLATVALVWPEWKDRFRTSRAYRIEARVDGEWRIVTSMTANPERPWSAHEVALLDPVDAVRVVQPPGGGSAELPDRLWVAQIECFGVES